MNKPESWGKLGKVGTNMCLCRACGEVFGGVRGFDKHRIGDADSRACATPPAMRKMGLEISSRGFWSLPYGKKEKSIES